MPRVGFEPTIPVFERAKTVHASDRAVTVTGTHETALHNCLENIFINNLFPSGKTIFKSTFLPKY
jgi:hypothetical protein